MVLALRHRVAHASRRRERTEEPQKLLAAVEEALLRIEESIEKQFMKFRSDRIDDEERKKKKETRCRLLRAAPAS